MGNAFETYDQDIPVTFDYNGATYRGTFDRPLGSGGGWQLMVNSYYWGTLILYEDWPGGLPVDLSKAHTIEKKWRFASQDERLKDQADYFGDVVTAWYQ